MKPLRWGFLSTAGIARKNWVAIQQSENSMLTAVASRDADRAQAFINECQVTAPFPHPPQVLGSYEALLASPDVDAVYIPLPTGLRAPWVIRAAEAGKHILCEKPCATSTAELELMLAACQRYQVQFMDGVMFMHQQRLGAVRTVLDDGASVGQIRRIMSIFSFRGHEGFGQQNIRTHGDLEPAGCLGDLGWYCLRFALWAMHWQLPLEVTGRLLSVPEARPGAAAGPQEFSGELLFADGVSAGFYCAFTVPNQCWVNVSGTNGSLRMDDFVHPFDAAAPAYQLNRELVPVPADSLPVQSQETRMINAFARQVQSGQLNAEWPAWSWHTQLVQDACLTSARNRGRPVPVAGTTTPPEFSSSK